MGNGMSDFFQLGNIVFDNVSFQQAVDKIVDKAKVGHTGHVVTPNAYHCLLAETDRRLIEACDSSLLCLADGVPIIWASRLCNKQLKSTVSGSDLVPRLCEAAAKEEIPVYFMGGLEGEADLAARNLKAKYPGLKVAGTNCPPFGFEHDPEYNEKMVEEIKKSGAKIVFVGVGTPKQEKWVAEHPIPGVIGVGIGMSIAFCAGTQARAPIWMQKAGLEWFFRFLQEPKRLAFRYARTFKIFALIARAYMNRT